MKKGLLKRITTMAIMMSCFAGLAFSVSASEAANNSVTIVTYSFPANNVVGYSTTKVTPGQHWPHAYITSVNFIGVPSNTWTSGAHIKSALFNTADVFTAGNTLSC